MLPSPYITTANAPRLQNLSFMDENFGQVDEI